MPAERNGLRDELSTAYEARVQKVLSDDSRTLEPEVAARQPDGFGGTGSGTLDDGGPVPRPSRMVHNALWQFLVQ